MVDGKMLAAIYPFGPDGIRVMSRHLVGKPVADLLGIPASVDFRFKEQRGE